MKVGELAKIINIHPLTIIRWIRKGKLKATKRKHEPGVGGHDYWDISEEDFNDYLRKVSRENNLVLDKKIF